MSRWSIEHEKSAGEMLIHTTCNNNKKKSEQTIDFLHTICSKKITRNGREINSKAIVES